MLNFTAAVRLAPVLLCLGLGLGGGCARAIAQHDRDSARINYDLGVASLNKGDPRGALRALYAAVKADPELPQAHNALGLVYHTMGKNAPALQHYRQAVALKADFSEAYNNMGIVLLATGQYDAAISAFEAALSNILYSTPHLAEGNMGWAYYKLGEVARARAHIEAAVAAQPRFCRGYEWLARIALEHPDAKGEALVNQCKRFFHHCLEDPHIAAGIPADYRREMQYYLGMGYQRQGRAKLAAEQFAQCAAGFDPALYVDAAAADGADESLGQYARRCAQAAARP